ncbi:S8 family serine peptidase [Cellulomonas fimi]|uniref:Peptidase S8 and S53 subtilisin kexin sedolisin n=1 Tax=Cellulomonas fimi (strain ATCC 484 / DSM 20113 / JCM 1341 / CCUG 24087 / LMG 16345 / NBRC 15513 / NCIMB 8980 / NCTC 7547 / NRS-133) TaxID=590998 RepID=F4H6V1_CELFA|nr:S8 family serine peptidase [Cellulomonas fimi]AEE44460.1 peptidase S8 and S53 subtilisin kexin sedolisin [Cellulomonas fimi ATCC 484]NNH06641.1 S8 family serine peptidase [Cellulomonas fimi]VEH26403.1 Thermophilic serine proteinase precursor [Cellulomonas fimi]
MASTRSVVALALVALLGVTVAASGVPTAGGGPTAADAIATAPQPPAGVAGEPRPHPAAQAVPAGQAAPAPSDPERDDELPVYTAPGADDGPGAAPETRPADHVLVRFEPGVSASGQREALRAAGVSGGTPVPGTSFVEVPVGDEDAADVVARLAQEPGVGAVQEDHVRHAFGWTDDPLLELTWPYVDLTRLPRAWEVSQGAGVVVAVLDSGVDANHEDLTGKVLPGADLVDGTLPAQDPDGHGTLVAGVAAAAGDNGKGAVGAAYGATVLPVRVLAADGTGTDSTVAAGITWAVANGADVINLSLGGPQPSPALLEAIRSAVATGVVVVVAAGNEGTQVPQYPAAYAPDVLGLLSVSATDDLGALAGWSTWGDSVTLAAPGLLIAGPRAGTTSGYVYGSGTSFAAPVVSGVAALLLAASPGLSPTEVERRLVASARDAGPRGLDPYYGAGVVDAASAVTSGAAVRAAVGVPLDRAPGDAGGSDDTPATARATADGTATGTLSPEGDVDWHATTAASAGQYRVRVEPVGTTPPTVGPELDLAVEVQDGAGLVLGTVDAAKVDAPEELVVTVPSAGPLRVGVRNANGSAPAAQQYRLSVTAESVQPLFSASFTPPADARRTNVGALTPADVTGDGRTDVVTVEPAGGVYVYAGRGDGTLAAPVDVPLTGITLTGDGLASGDVDGDGDADAVATTSTGFVVLRQDAGRLTPWTQVATTFGGAPFAGQVVELASWDTDGRLDVVVSTSRPSVQVFRNDGSGRFTAVAEAAAEPRLAVGDVTGDGRPDVVTTHAVLAQRTDGLLAAPLALPFAGGPLVTSVAVGDVTGDGRADVVRVNGNRARVDGVLPTGALAPTALYPVGGEDGGTVTLGDMDVDGRTDVLVADAFNQTLSLLRQLPGGTLSAPVLTPIDPVVYDRPGQLRVTRLDADASPDVVLAQNGVLALRQTRLAAPTARPGWLLASTPAPHDAGVAVRPTVRLSFARDLRSTDVTTPCTALKKATPCVLLVDASTGSPVAATARWEAGTRTVALTPNADLVPGRHYTAIVADVRDTALAALPAPVRVPFTVAAGGDRYTPIDPVRVADTRDPSQPATYGARRSGERLVLTLDEVLPPDATAVVLSLASTGHGSVGNVRVFPTAADGSGPAPRVANLNVVPGVDQPNLATVQLGAGRTIALMPEGPTTNLVVDVFGYYSPGGASGYVPVTPTRMLDTRSGTGGVPAGAVTGGHWVDLRVAGVQGVPADATAVVLNVAGTGVQGGTFVSVVPTPDLGEAWNGPTTSNLNLYPGRDQSNLVTVKVGENGRVRFWVNRSTTHLVADLAGYYTATGTNGLVPVQPVRVADTRAALGFPGRLRALTPTDVKIGGTAAVPAQATAAVVNIAGVGPTWPTHVRAFPTTVPATLPDIATINLAAGRDESNMSVLTLGVDGKVTFYARSSDVDMVVDVFGWFRTYR